MRKVLLFLLFVLINSSASLFSGSCDQLKDLLTLKECPSCDFSNMNFSSSYSELCPHQNPEFSPPDTSSSILSLVNQFPAGVDLGGANFSHATLNGINLNGASLVGAQFVGSMLGGNVVLDNSDLQGANLSGAYLAGASFKNAKLGPKNCSLPGMPACAGAGASLYGANLTNTNFDHATLSLVGFAGADLSGASFKHAILVELVPSLGQELTVVDSNGDTRSYSRGNPLDLRAVKNRSKADFSYANLTGVNLSSQTFGSEFNFDHAILAGADFTKSTFNRSIFNNVTLSQAKFIGAKFIDASFNGGVFSNGRSGTGVIFDSPGGVYTAAPVSAPVVNKNTVFNDVRFNSTVLDYASFKGVMLMSSSFAWISSMRHVDFTGSTLHGMGLERFLEGSPSLATGTLFTNATLSGLNLSGKNITDSSMNFKGATIGLSSLAQGTTFGSGVNFENAKFSYGLESPTFSGSNFKGATLKGMSLQNILARNNATFENAKFDGSYIANLNASYTSFKGASFTDLNQGTINGITCSHCNFDNADLTGVDWWKHSCNINNSSFSGSKGDSGLRTGNPCHKHADACRYGIC